MKSVSPMPPAPCCSTAVQRVSRCRHPMPGVFQIAAYDAPGNKGNGSALVLSLLDNAGGNTILYNLKN